VMLIVEDLHWVDPSSLEFLSRCVELPKASCVLIMLTCRPEFDAGWRTRRGVTLLGLGGLDVARAEELVALAARGKALPPEVVRQIVRRAGGIPLFIEETTRAVVESGQLQDTGDRYELVGSLSSPSVPMSLRDALMARLDRLGAVKSLVQLGATIGYDFSYGLLQAVSGADHTVLQQQLGVAVLSGLLQAHGTIPDATFVFKHALVRDTAYQSLLRKTQQLHHQRIAAALEGCYPEIAEQRPELLAHHHTEAGNITAAVPYWQKAGGQAISRAAFAEAIAHVARGLRLLERLPDSPERDREELTLQSPLAIALQAHRGYAAPEVDLAYKRARDLCRRVGGAAEFLSVSRGQTLFYVVRADLGTAMELGAELLRLGADNRNAEYLVEGHLTTGLVLNYLGRFVEARSHLEHGLACYKADDRPLASFQYGGHSPAFCHSYQGRVLSFLGYYDQALRSSEEGLARAQALSIPLSQAQALGMLALLHQTRREFAAAHLWADKAISYASEFGFAYWSALGSMVRGWIIAHEGQLDEGIANLRQGLDRYRATGAKLGLSWFLAMLGELYGMSRQWEQGLEAVTQGLDHAAATGERYYEAELHRLKGELLLGQVGAEAAEAAEACFGLALDVARNQRARSWELRAATSLSRLWRDQNRCEEAWELLAGIYTWFTEGFAVADLRDAQKLLDELTKRQSGV
jgi:predicted ATPase